MSNSESISERDKPFVLALVASGITVLNIVFAAVGALIDNQLMVATSIDVLKFTFPLTMAAWTFYFGKSKE
jgi:hypothetical protein